MWIKKSSKELLSDLRARLIGAVLFLAVAIILVGMLGFSHAGLHFPIWVRILGLMLAGILLLAWHLRSQWHRERAGVLVCEKCGRVKVNESQNVCLCGTRMSPMCEMKWIETPPLTGRVPSEPHGLRTVNI